MRAIEGRHVHAVSADSNSILMLHHHTRQAGLSLVYNYLLLLLPLVHSPVGGSGGGGFIFSGVGIISSA